MRKHLNKVTWGSVSVLGVLLGISILGGFNTAMESTNTLEFCISCHEMRNTVYVEYQKSAHFKNASGVRAICSDCHVPKTWAAKLMRKLRASKEIYHKFMGTIDTKEKFEARRLEMAERVWAEMTANNSRECRSCHEYDTMAFEHQGDRARRKMEAAKENGENCIECHKGIAHNNPEEDEDD